MSLRLLPVLSFHDTASVATIGCVILTKTAADIGKCAWLYIHDILEVDNYMYTAYGITTMSSSYIISIVKHDIVVWTTDPIWE